MEGQLWLIDTRFKKSRILPSRRLQISGEEKTHNHKSPRNKSMVQPAVPVSLLSGRFATHGCCATAVHMFVCTA